MAQRRTGDGRVAMAIVVVSIIIASSATGLVATRGQALRAFEEEHKKGPFALDFHLVTIDGKPLNGTDLRGRPVVIDLMATWCGVCRVQMPMMNDTYNKHKGEMTMVSIDLDAYETDEQLRAYRDQYHAQWPFALDRTGSVFGAFYPGGYPTLVFMDRDGRVVLMHEGAISQADLEADIALII